MTRHVRFPLASSPVVRYGRQLNHLLLGTYELGSLDRGFELVHLARGRVLFWDRRARLPPPAAEEQGNDGQDDENARADADAQPNLQGIAGTAPGIRVNTIAIHRTLVGAICPAIRTIRPTIRSRHRARARAGTRGRGLLPIPGRRGSRGRRAGDGAALAKLGLAARAAVGVVAAAKPLFAAAVTQAEADAGEALGAAAGAVGGDVGVAAGAEARLAAVAAVGAVAAAEAETAAAVAFGAALAGGEDAFDEAAVAVEAYGDLAAGERVGIEVELGEQAGTGGGCRAEQEAPEREGSGSHFANLWEGE